MLRLIKYLKPYLVLIGIAVILLFIQANADLALPDYMSKIVNVGIQQGGIDSAVPEALRASEMDRLILFMDEKDHQYVLDKYEYVDDQSEDFQQYIEKYPVLEQEPIFVLKQVDDSIIEMLNPIMGKSLLIVAGIQEISKNPQSSMLLPTNMGIDLTKLPPGTDLFEILKLMPPDMLSNIKTQIDNKITSLGDDMVIQAAAAAIKEEYKALGIDTDKLQLNYILHSGISMLLLTLLSGVCTITVSYLSARTGAGLARDLRRRVFQRVESFSGIEFSKFSTASLITRSTNDITQIQMVIIMMMRMVIYAPIIGIGGIIRALSKTTSMWWLIALAVVILLGLILTVFSIALPKFKSIQKLIDRLNLVSRESLTGMMVIRAFNMQKHEEARFDHANKDLTSTMLFINRIMVIMMPVMMMVMNGLMLMIIWVGAHEVAKAQMQVGDMMAFMQYAMQIVFAFLMLAMMFIILPRASVSGDRIAEVLDTEPEIVDPVSPKHFPKPFMGSIEFSNVSFRYPGAEEDVLHNVSFKIKAGETTAFIGTTGSGKSTIVSLIPRFYDVTSGVIRIDGMDIREISQADLREKIGYIPQKSMLFSGTIESNLLFADESASASKIRDAVVISQSAEFIDSSPDGMSSEVSQGGTNYSGGQKQRLSIARALVKKAPIVIFDDSFSALDFKTDAALRKALKVYNKDATVLIVTQRVPTIKNADNIIVLDQGRVTCMGKHNELMRNCDIYREIAQSQLNEEELL